MTRYILADIKRVLKRIPHWVIVALALIFFGSTGSGEGRTVADVVDSAKTTFIYACVPCGFLAIVFVLGDDLRAKTAQIAIGIGISREKVILSKWLECMVLAFIDELILLFSTTIGVLINGIAFKASDWGELFLVLIMSVIATGVYLALVFPIITVSGGTSVALLIYIFLSTGLINKGLGYLELVRPIQKLHIIGKTPTNLINVCRSRMILGNFAFAQWIGIILFLAVFLGVSILIYKKQELEF